MFRRAPYRLFLALVVGAALTSVPAEGQAGHAVAGTLAGAAEGAYLTLALTTAAARTGHYVFAPSQALWQLTPIPVAAVAGGLLGYHDADRLRDSVRYGLVGFAAGAGAGSIVGVLLADGPEGVWTGAIVGSGIGLLVGSLWGALRSQDHGGGVGVPAVTLTIPFGP
jgi:hypothetical protein